MISSLLRRRSLLTVSLIITLLTACSKPQLLIDEFQYFETAVKNNPGVDKNKLKSDGFELFYASVGHTDKPVALFIHGTPGGWHDGARYLMDKNFREQVRVVVIDRLGWGESQSYGGRVEFTFEQQAIAIKPLLAKLKADHGGRKLIVVGHSLGASLAPLLAINYPDLVDGLVLISGSLDPELGQPRWYNMAASMGMVSWFLDPELKQANREIMPLTGELKKLLPRWQTIKVPVTLIQGMKDQLVSPKNADFVEGLLPAEQLKVIRLEHAGHFIPWQQREVVTGAVIEQLAVEK